MQAGQVIETSLRLDYIHERGGFWFLVGAGDTKVTIVIYGPETDEMRAKMVAVGDAIVAATEAAKKGEANEQDENGPREKRDEC